MPKSFDKQTTDSNQGPTIRFGKIKRVPENIPPFDKEFIEKIKDAAIPKPKKKNKLRQKMHREDI